MKDKLIPLFLLIVAAISYLSWVQTANSHEWFTDQTNPVTSARCCNNLDCLVIENEDWWEKSGVIYVRWKNGEIYAIPANQAAPSQDHEGRAAACVWAGKLRCFFTPALF